MKNFCFLSVLLFFVFSCQSKKATAENNSFKTDTLTYFDQSRNRKIPLAVYESSNKKLQNKIPVIFSHGYGANKGNDYLADYTYLLEFLAEKGYFVVSIQHELKTDELLAMDEPFKVTRIPNWKRGAENIGFVLQQIKKNYPNLNYPKLALIGHSNGGDMSVLFTHQFPGLVNKLISMDNRRMDLPRTSQPKIYSLRSDDYPADKGVLPTEDEQKKFGITIEFTNIHHSNMDNDANEEERKYLTSKIIEYLNEK